MVKPLVCCGLVLLSQSRGALGFSLQTPPPSAPTTTSASATPAQTSAGVRINSAEITQNGETLDVGFSVSGGRIVSADACPVALDFNPRPGVAFYILVDLNHTTSHTAPAGRRVVPIPLVVATRQLRGRGPRRWRGGWRAVTRLRNTRERTHRTRTNAAPTKDTRAKRYLTSTPVGPSGVEWQKTAANDVRVEAGGDGEQVYTHTHQPTHPPTSP